ncbi:MAG: phosphoserine phosphatase SerB [Desulforhopalus sp.]
MNYILTLVSSEIEKPLLHDHLKEVEKCLSVEVQGLHWLSPGKAADLQLSDRPDKSARMALELLLSEDRIDFFIITDDHVRRKKLLVADMDNTMVVGETLDELAAQCGLKEKIAAITDLAMRGDLDFQAALRSRVAMLQNLPELALQKTLAEIRPMPGAELLIKTMRNHGAMCVLASGGFTCFTEPIGKMLFFQFSHGNRLEIRDGLLTGKVKEPVLDHQSKLFFLQHYQATGNLDITDTLAIGDGANDLAMINGAGLGVGFHPKPFLKERVENNVLYGDLTALLYAQGYEKF